MIHNIQDMFHNSVELMKRSLWSNLTGTQKKAALLGLSALALVSLILWRYKSAFSKPKIEAKALEKDLNVSDASKSLSHSKVSIPEKDQKTQETKPIERETTPTPPSQSLLNSSRKVEQTIQPKLETPVEPPKNTIPVQELIDQPKNPEISTADKLLPPALNLTLSSSDEEKANEPEALKEMGNTPEIEKEIIKEHAVVETSNPDNSNTSDTPQSSNLSDSVFSFEHEISKSSPLPENTPVPLESQEAILGQLADKAENQSQLLVQQSVEKKMPLITDYDKLTDAQKNQINKLFNTLNGEGFWCSGNQEEATKILETFTNHTHEAEIRLFVTMNRQSEVCQYQISKTFRISTKFLDSFDSLASAETSDSRKTLLMQVFNEMKKAVTSLKTS